MKISRRVKTWLIIFLCVGVMLLIRLKPSVVIVGYFAGECYGLCDVKYQITDHQLIMDEVSNVDTIPSIRQTIEGNFDSLKFKLPLLVGLDPRAFGCPDCADGGGYYLGYKIFGIELGHRLDPRHDPGYFPEMTTLIRDRMDKIKQLQLLYNKSHAHYPRN